MLFAGKAHPADVPGQDLIRRISQIAHLPEFEGRLLLVEGYDLRLARRMVAGVDIWLNNPIYPLEASVERKTQKIPDTILRSNDMRKNPTAQIFSQKRAGPCGPCSFSRAIRRNRTDNQARTKRLLYRLS